MGVLLLLSGGINQTRVGRSVFRLKILDRFKVGRVGHDFGELLQLLELIQLGFFLVSDSNAHNKSSVWLEPKAYAPNGRSTIENLLRLEKPVLILLRAELGRVSNFASQTMFQNCRGWRRTTLDVGVPACEAEAFSGVAKARVLKRSDDRETQRESRGADFGPVLRNATIYARV